MVADLEIACAPKDIGNAGEELGKKLHLVGVVVGVAVELPDAKVGRHAHAGLEGCQGDLGLLRQTLFGNGGGDILGDPLECFRVHLGGIEHVLAAFCSGQLRLGYRSFVFLAESFLDAIERELVVVW